MMKYLGYGLTMMLGLALGLGVMVVAMTPPPSTIQVVVHNTSGQDASQIIITHEEGTVSIRTLASGTTQTALIIVKGESSYHIQATLANGEVVKGQEAYVEPGYKLREIITTTSIKHKIQSFSPFIWGN